MGTRLASTDAESSSVMTNIIASLIINTVALDDTL